VETFSQSAARSFVTINGDTYYKLPEINSWFVANGDRWGIFINDVTEDTVMKLKDLMVFANKKVISDWEKFAVPRICKDDSEKLVKISSSTLTLKQEGLMAVIQGEGTSHTVECSVQIDFSLPNKGKLISFQVGDAPVATGNVVQESTPVVEEKTPDTVSRETSQTIVPTEWNPKVSQFPLNEEKGLTYSSSRGGYAVKFPSANISYSVSAVKESFGQADLSCSYVINVIKYSDKELLEISPSIRIYECTSKGGVTSP